MTNITADINQVQKILKKYKGISEKELVDWIIKKCIFYNQKEDDTKTA